MNSISQQLACLFFEMRLEACDNSIEEGMSIRRLVLVCLSSYTQTNLSVGAVQYVSIGEFVVLAKLAVEVYE